MMLVKRITDIGTFIVVLIILLIILLIIVIILCCKFLLIMGYRDCVYVRGTKRVNKGAITRSCNCSSREAMDTYP